MAIHDPRNPRPTAMTEADLEMIGKIDHELELILDRTYDLRKKITKLTADRDTALAALRISVERQEKATDALKSVRAILRAGEIQELNLRSARALDRAMDVITSTLSELDAEVPPS